MNRTRIAAGLAGAAVLAATAAAALAPATAGASDAPRRPAVIIFGDPAFRSADGLFLAMLGSPMHPGSAGSANCRVVVPPAVNAQTSFVTRPVGANTFNIVWANGDGRALANNDEIAGVGGPSRFVGISHNPGDPSAVWHLAGGQIVNGIGLALRLTPSGAEAVPAGTGGPGAQITELTGVC